MLKNWLIAGSLLLYLVANAQEVVVDFYPDNSFEEVADRISCMQTEVPLQFNERVMAFVDYFSIKNREYTRDIVRKKEQFFPTFSASLKKYNLPDELKYLSIVESGLRPNAISRANAVGLWQFISSTGKAYGLNNNWYVDERMDPVEATDAASRYLRDLYNMFDSWELALAAYNCGPGNVRKAIRRSQYKRNFWEIHRHLPRETRSYLPQYVAITYLLNHLDHHNLLVDSEVFYPEWDTIMITRYFHLETFANNHEGLCLNDLLKLNPQIKRGVLPEGTKNFALKIPSDLKQGIVTNRKFLYDTASKIGKKHLEYLARNTPGSTYGRTKLVYRVRRGDVLGTIAQKYHVRISALRSWNRIRGNLIKVGQRLNIWVLPDYHAKTKSLYTAKPPTKSGSKLSESGNKKIYYVQPGDSLWSISKDNNTTIEKLKTANKLVSNSIKAGQSLVIPTK